MSLALQGGFFTTGPPGKPQGEVIEFLFLAKVVNTLGSGKDWNHHERIKRSRSGNCQHFILVSTECFEGLERDSRLP